MPLDEGRSCLASARSRQAAMLKHLSARQPLHALRCYPSCLASCSIKPVNGRQLTDAAGVQAPRYCS